MLIILVDSRQLTSNMELNVKLNTLFISVAFIHKGYIRKILSQLALEKHAKANILLYKLYYIEGQSMHKFKAAEVHKFKITG